MTRETSAMAYQAIIDSLGFARACRAAAQAGWDSIQSHPGDRRFTRQEVEDRVRDTRGTVGRRCRDLVEYGVLRENGTRRNVSRVEGEEGQLAIAFEFTGSLARKGERPNKKLNQSMSVMKTLAGLITDMTQIAKEAKAALEFTHPDCKAVCEVTKAALEGIVENIEYRVGQAMRLEPPKE